MKYICSGNIMLDTVKYPDGTTSGTHIGGPAIFAYAGIKLWDDDCQMLTNVGSDYDEYYGQWMRQNSATYQGITVMSDFCTHHYLTYHDDGTYDWEYVHGAHKGAINMGFLEMHPYQFEAACDQDSVLYFPISLENHTFWDQLLEVKRKKKFTFMWEIGATSAVPENLERIRQICSQIEMFSINYPEAKVLFGVDTEEEVLRGMKSLGVPFSIMRIGKRGMYTIEGQNHWLIDSILMDQVDATGCGNCSTGAAMYAYHKTKDPVMAGIMANISAGYNVMQYGPCKDLAAVRREAEQLAQKTYQQYRERYGL
ncbi:carbohydrate kinase family protein [Neobittarella massiliensis]|uniref:carbohydrate kinase family protein n=1 Tax=Neobittarella massiliensis (ex Bilen et al. 2018) TaxID=2041842 RepID=UPI000CF6B0B4|nr:PfkB family carbohydrate kinase [Neobittarella massiliensis]